MSIKRGSYEYHHTKLKRLLSNADFELCKSCHVIRGRISFQKNTNKKDMEQIIKKFIEHSLAPIVLRI